MCLYRNIYPNWRKKQHTCLPNFKTAVSVSEVLEFDKRTVRTLTEILKRHCATGNFVGLGVLHQDCCKSYHNEEETESPMAWQHRFLIDRTFENQGIAMNVSLKKLSSFNRSLDFYISDLNTKDRVVGATVESLIPFRHKDNSFPFSTGI